MRLRKFPVLRTFPSQCCHPHHFQTRPISTASRPDLSSKHALITGGSRGIGLSIAQLLASNSCRCTLVSRSQDSLRQALPTLSAPPPDSSPHRYIAGDISSQSFWDSLTSSAGQEAEPSFSFEGEKVDILVNAAGVTHSSLLVRTEPEDLERVLSTNLTAIVWAVRYLIKRKFMWGGKGKDEGEKAWNPVIINIASLLGLQGGRGAAAYAASKAGLLGLTRALAAELGPTGIRVSAIAPGYIETDMTAGIDPKARAQILERIPLARFGQADEIAEAALFLVMNQYANNCIINLDGGLSAT